MIRKAAAQGVPELAWFKSSYSSDGNEGDCVEVAHAPRAVHVRDSKQTSGPRLALSGTAWAAFLAHAARR
ncbi:DUF397 domain-containing protein [Streptomyces venezuelae]|uniref:DUF397 domain-containing protein n=1 Tax=Streptomyces venezuelae TaxID=54571 RepID=A0A5P2CKB1_STRVZ|nr:DUF397 domain-containing protein [Streptomyces venezuelae]QES43302.1 DUF397 domain-containing protein [Streptomyces venezuelae]